MTIIKLDAIDSTNSYLKKLALKKDLNNYTIVRTEHQTNGRGQMGTSWMDEKGKNLIFSMLVRFDDFEFKKQFYLSMAISLGLFKVLSKRYKNVKIKWPNDIMSDRDKIAGILIENSVKTDVISHSCIGVGLNVNQLTFDASLHNVTSLRKLSGELIDRDALLNDLIDSIMNSLKLLHGSNFGQLKKEYLKALYKINAPAMFKDNNGKIFLGKIVDVNEMGQLVIMTSDENCQNYNLKEIMFAPTAD